MYQRLCVCCSCLQIENFSPEWLSNLFLTTQLPSIWIRCACENLPYSKESSLRAHTWPVPPGINAKWVYWRRSPRQERSRAPTITFLVLLPFQSAMLWADITRIAAPYKGVQDNTPILWYFTHLQGGQGEKLKKLSLLMSNKNSLVEWGQVRR